MLIVYLPEHCRWQDLDPADLEELCQVRYGRHDTSAVLQTCSHWEVTCTNVTK